MASTITIAGTATVAQSATSVSSGFSTRIPLTFPVNVYASVGVIEKVVPANSSVTLSLADIGTLAPCVMILTSNVPVAVQDAGAASMKAVGTFIVIGNSTSTPVVATTSIQITNPSLTSAASVQITLGFNQV
jgi:hypothetical protein